MRASLRTRFACVPLLLAGAVGVGACSHPIARRTVVTEPEHPADPCTTDDPPPERPGPFDGTAFVARYAEEHLPLLAPIEETAEVLSRRVRTMRPGNARRETRKKLVYRRLADALAATDPAERERIHAAMRRDSRLAVQGNREALLATEIAFAEVWFRFRTQASGAALTADLFFQQHVADRELLRIATMIRAELALARNENAFARDALAVLMTSATDPLHVYATYRTATAYCNEQKTEECRLWLDRVRFFGCAPGPPHETAEFALRAFFDLGMQPIPRCQREPETPVYCTRSDTVSYRQSVLHQ